MFKFRNWKKDYYNLKREYLNCKLQLSRDIEEKEEMINSLFEQVVDVAKLRKSNASLKSHNAKYKEKINAQEETIKEQLLLIETLQKEKVGAVYDSKVN